MLYAYVRTYIYTNIHAHANIDTYAHAYVHTYMYNVQLYVHAVEPDSEKFKIPQQNVCYTVNTR